MTWIIEFVLRISMGVLGGALFGVVGVLVMGGINVIIAPSSTIESEMHRSAELFTSILTTEGGHTFLFIFVIIAMINTFLDMNNLKETYVDDGYDSVDTGNDHYMNTQIFEHYGYKV